MEVLRQDADDAEILIVLAGYRIATYCIFTDEDGDELMRFDVVNYSHN